MGNRRGVSAFFTRNVRVLGFLVAILLAGMGLLPTGASALVAANTRIIAPVNLTYWNGVTTVTVTASATVIVTTVSSLPDVITADVVLVYAGPDTAAVIPVTVTSTGNGPETFSLAASYNSPVNTDAPLSPIIPSPFVLGGSVTLAGSTAEVLLVPSDAVSDGSVNGFEPGDRIVLNGEERIISSIVDAASGTSQILLASPLSSVPGAGLLVSERVTLSVTAYSGTIQTPGSVVSVPVSIAVNNPSGSVTLEPVAIFSTGTPVLEKYVRNRTSSNAGSGAQYVYAGETYYRQGVTAAPGDELGYLLRFVNYGSGGFPDARIEDQASLNLSLVAGGFAGKDLRYVDEAGVEVDLTFAADTDSAEQQPSNLLVIYIGSGATASTGGSVAAGDQILVLYRATVLP